MSDDINSALDSQKELFTPQQALVLNEEFWRGILEDMNNRAITILSSYISLELETKARNINAHRGSGEFSIRLESGIDDLESAIIEVAMNEKPGCHPARAYQRWIEMYHSEDPRVRAFLRSNNIRTIFDKTLKRFEEIGWVVETSDSNEGGVPKKIDIHL